MRLVSGLIYNEIGQTAFKKLDSKDSVNYMQTIGYLYNERGWLRQANAPRFNMVLSYNADANKAYNGNIMYQFWGVPGNLSNHYTYTYDKLNRLTSGITSADNFQESGITYDTQGNLTALNRYSNGSEIDQLSYFYNNKNSLDSVRDANASNSGLVSGLTKYTYDGNGNMLSAANTLNGGQNKGITYNLLNLPNVVTIPTGTYTYTYDAAGNKLRMVKVISGSTTNTDYIGGIQYSGTPTESIAFIQTEEGKAVPYGTNSYDYTYYLGDNLGNTRITFDTKYGRDSLQQKDDYYPFGLEINRSTSSPKNEYLYNKKELQEDFTEYDYGARFYDPILGRWTSVDRSAAKFVYESPYDYGGDNPITNIDIGGMFKYPPGKAGERQARAFKKFTQYLHKGGIDQLLKSKALEAAYAKYGKLTPDQLKKDFTWGSGPTINIVDNPGGVKGGSGWTDPLNPMHIEINADIVRQFENASSDDERAALLAAALEVLHEEAHSGEDRAGLGTFGGPDPGTEVVKEAYGIVMKMVDGQLIQIYVPYESLDDMKNIIKEKEKTEDGQKLIPVYPNVKKPGTEPPDRRTKLHPGDDKNEPVNIN